MKLNDVIRYLECTCYVEIYVEYDKEPSFKGGVIDIPWYMLEYELFNDENGEAIDATKMTNDYGVEQCGFQIYLKEPKEDK